MIDRGDHHGSSMMTTGSEIFFSFLPHGHMGWG